ncbi:MAG TPA: hypothetical protein VFO41_11485 [Alphaproteobacteria bacterium]|nr:hypothetical protein [Alphaproteobacteria bacterium]
MTASKIDEAEQKRIALNLLLDAWDEALDQGVLPEILATTAIYTALTDMVETHGEEPVAELFADLPRRIRSGEFTLRKPL